MEKRIVEVTVVKMKKEVPTVIEINGHRYVYEPKTQYKGGKKK